MESLEIPGERGNMITWDNEFSKQGERDRSPPGNCDSLSTVSQIQKKKDAKTV